MSYNDVVASMAMAGRKQLDAKTMYPQICEECGQWAQASGDCDKWACPKCTRIQDVRKLTQPLAIKAVAALEHVPDTKDRAVCGDCLLVFHPMWQTKHGHCPECNSDNWVK